MGKEPTREGVHGMGAWDNMSASWALNGAEQGLQDWGLTWLVVAHETI